MCEGVVERFYALFKFGQVTAGWSISLRKLAAAEISALGIELIATSNVGIGLDECFGRGQSPDSSRLYPTFHRCMHIAAS